jgi:hypothetical protein
VRTGFSTLKSSGPNGTPDSLRSLYSSAGGGGRGDTDLRVGMLRPCIRDERSSMGLGECLGLTAGLVARGLTIGIYSFMGDR